MPLFALDELIADLKVLVLTDEDLDNLMMTSADSMTPVKET